MVREGRWVRSVKKPFAFPRGKPRFQRAGGVFGGFARFWWLRSVICHGGEGEAGTKAARQGGASGQGWGVGAGTVGCEKRMHPDLRFGFPYVIYVLVMKLFGKF